MNQKRVLAATSISYAVVLLDTSIVNVALGQLAVSFHAGIVGLQWVVTGYTIAFASLLLTAGAVADRLGARNAYLAALAIFVSASGLCGISPNLPTLIAARVIQGIGAALLVPCSLKLIHQAFPEQEARARAVGLWVGCGGVALALGPVVGGVLIHLFGWRSIFYVNLPIGLAGIRQTLKIAREDKSSLTRSFDVVGQVSVILFLASLITLLIDGRTLGWTSRATFVILLAACASGSLFLLNQSRNLDPILPASFFENRLLLGSSFVSTASAFVFYGLLFTISLYYEEVRHLTPLRTGLSLLPLTTMVTFGSICSGRVVERMGLRRSVGFAFGLYAIGAAGVLYLKESAGLAGFPMLAIGLASGFISPAATAPALGTVGESQAGLAAAVLNSARQTGSACGVAFFGSVIALFHLTDIAMNIVLLSAAMVALGAAGLWSALVAN